MFLRIPHISCRLCDILQSHLTIIKPVPKAVEPIGDQIFRCSEIEPGVD
jgi:hypothetical protein